MRNTITLPWSGFIFILLFGAPVPMPAQQWEWAFKTENLENIRTAVTNDGSTYVTGYFQDSCLIREQIIYGAAAPNVNSILFKLLADGTVGWYQLLNGRSVITNIQT